MKRLIAATLSLAMIFAMIPTAKADNSEEVIIGILGGALGGLIIGEALGSRRERVIERQYIYEDYYEPVVTCYVKKVRVYNPNTNRYVYVKRRVCN